MSSNKELNLISDLIIRQSFDERICDGLCQLILTYLSAKDQLRLRCVSKQFQRTIMTSNRLLSLNCRLNERQSLKKFENVLQKFPNIKEIKDNMFVDDYKYFFFRGNDVNYNPVLELIFKYCPNLNDLSHYFSFILKDIHRMNDKNMNCFNELFSSKLISVDIIPTNESKEFLASIKQSNVEHLMVTKFCKELTNIRFTKLKKLKVSSLRIEEFDNFEVFAETNAKNIKHLTIHMFWTYILMLETNEPKNTREESLKRLLKIITKFKNLVHLELNNKLLANHLNQIAFNCNQLKSLNIFYNLDIKNGKTIDNMFEPLQQLKQFKRLNLCLVNNGTTDQEFKENCYLYLFKAFEVFNELTHLEIKFGFNISEYILTEIETKLPKLRSLKIHSLIFVSEWTATTLSRLSRLESIDLLISDKKMKSIIETKLIKNCKRIRNITIHI